MAGSPWHEESSCSLFLVRFDGGVVLNSQNGNRYQPFPWPVDFKQTVHLKRLISPRPNFTGNVWEKRLSNLFFMPWSVNSNLVDYALAYLLVLFVNHGHHPRKIPSMCNLPVHDSCPVRRRRCEATNLVCGTGKIVRIPWGRDMRHLTIFQRLQTKFRIFVDRHTEGDKKADWVIRYSTTAKINDHRLGGGVERYSFCDFRRISVKGCKKDAQMQHRRQSANVAWWKKGSASKLLTVGASNSPQIRFDKLYSKVPDGDNEAQKRL